MFQKLLIAFIALFIITNRVSATEFPTLSELPKHHSVESLEEIEEAEEYEDVQTKKGGCLTSCMKVTKDICTDENIKLGKDIVEDFDKLVANLCKILNK